MMGKARGRARMAIGVRTELACQARLIELGYLDIFLPLFHDSPADLILRTSTGIQCLQIKTAQHYPDGKRSRLNFRGGGRARTGLTRSRYIGQGIAFVIVGAREGFYVIPMAAISSESGTVLQREYFEAWHLLGAPLDSREEEIATLEQMALWKPAGG